MATLMTNESYTIENIQHYFDTSHANKGALVKAGHAGHQLQWCVLTGIRRVYIPILKDEDTADAFWESNGLKCSVTDCAIADSGLMCVIECTELTFFKEMSMVVARILEERIVGAERVIRLFKNNRIFWAGMPNAMTTVRAAGLFGELFFMWNFLRSRIPSIIEQGLWGGPAQTDKDFNFAELQVEVKTAMSHSQPVSHQISTLHQLQNDRRPLILYSLIAHPDNGGGHSLFELVTNIHDELQESNSDLAVQFQELLHDCGYQIEDPRMELHRFHLLDDYGEFYAVCDDFPRLTTSDNCTDQRVNIDNYTITLTNVEHLGLNITRASSVPEMLAAYDATINGKKDC
jgi:hypothetical protein